MAAAVVALLGSDPHTREPAKGELIEVPPGMKQIECWSAKLTNESTTLLAHFAVLLNLAIGSHENVAA